MAVTKEQAAAELHRRRARAELDKRRGASGGAPMQADTVGAPQDAPVAPGTPVGPVPADGQWPITVGKAALPQSVNKIMKERGMGYNQRADALIGKAVADIGHGVKQLTTGLDEGDVADVEAWRALSEGASMDEGQGLINAGTAGDIAGAMGAFAAPLGAAEQGLIKLGSALPKWASKVGAAMGVGGAEGAAQPVLEGESRATNATIGAMLPGALSVAGQAGRKLVTQPFKVSRTGEALLDEDITPTLGQGVETEGTVFARLAKNMEATLEGIVPGITSNRRRAEQEVVDAVARRAAPPGATIPTARAGTPEYFHDLDSIYDDAYQDVLGTIPGRIDTLEVASVVNDALDNMGMMVNPSTKNQMRRVLNGIIDEFSAVGMSPSAARQFQQRIRKQLTKFSSMENANENTFGAVEILSAINDGMSSIFENKLGTAGAQRLKDIDLAYANKMLLETAKGYAKGGEEIGVKHLDRAMRARTGRSRRIRGGGLGQDIVDPAMEAMGGPKPSAWKRALSVSGLGFGGWAAPAVAAPALGISLLGGTKPGFKFLTGLYEPQRRVAKYMSEVVEPKIGTATALITSNED